MPRIREAEFGSPKREVPIVRPIESQGRALMQHGRDWVTPCVFHDEDTPNPVDAEGK